MEEGCMRPHRRPRGGWILFALGMVTLLASLSFVAWRQNRTRDALAVIEGMERQMALLRAEEAELRLRLQRLESRAYVVAEARSRLGMVAPGTDRLVLLLPGRISGDTSSLEGRP
jgi:cell division protein FtsB